MTDNYDPPPLSRDARRIPDPSITILVRGYRARSWAHAIHADGPTRDAAISKLLKALAEEISGMAAQEAAEALRTRGYL